MFTYSYTNVILNSCIISEGLVNFYDFTKTDTGGVCNKIFFIYSSLYSKRGGVVIQLMFELILSLVPISIFLCTYKPHDCFVCLGRDPNSCAYSIFQTNFVNKRTSSLVDDDLQTKKQSGFELYTGTSLKFSSDLSIPDGNAA